MKTLLKLFLFVFVLVSYHSYSQVSKQNAIDTLLNTILDDELDVVDVYMLNNCATVQDTILLFTNDSNLYLPYNFNWVFYIDDKPLANWFHDTRYIVMDSVTGVYSIFSRNTYPLFLDSLFTQVNSTFIRSGPCFPPAGAEKTQLLPSYQSNNDYAVLIAGLDNKSRYWYDVSSIYNTLIQVFGYKEENIFVLFGKGYSSMTSSDDLNNDGVDDFDFPAYITDVENVFNELSGASSLYPDIPVLGDEDNLFIYVTDHGGVIGSNSYICLAPETESDEWDEFFDYEFAALLENISCSQMSILLQQCFSGGFIDDLSDYVNYNVECKNRLIQTASDFDEESWGEFWMTNLKADEFTWYWNAVARGYFPDPTEPWMSVTEFPIGSFDYTNNFDCIMGWNHPNDYISDANSDELAQMEEIFEYANNFDTWSSYGFCDQYPAGNNSTETPQMWSNIGFIEDLVTLNGLSGIISNTQIIPGRSYKIGKELKFENGSYTTFAPNSSVHLSLNDSKILIEDGATLDMSSNSELFCETLGEAIKVDFGGKLILRNSSLHLDKPQTFLNLSGELEILNQSIFSFSGDGYMKFSNPGVDNTYNISCSNGTKFIFEGNGIDDKILEVQQSTVHFPDNLSELVLKDGKIEMGYNKRMQADGNYPITFDHLKITSDNESYNAHRSFRLHGQNNVTIDHCVFENGRYGLYGNLTYFGSYLTISNSTFQNNSEGLYIYNNGIHLSKCTFRNNTYKAIHCDNMEFSSDMNFVYMEDNYFGIDYQGSSGSDLSIKNSVIQDCTYDGIRTSGAFDLNLVCTYVKNNRYGIYTSNGTFVNMKDNASNLITGNNYAVYLNYGFLQVNNGSNNLKSTVYSVYGYASTICAPGLPSNLYAMHNQWDSGNNPPLYNSNYNLWVLNCNQQAVNIIDNNPGSIFCDHITTKIFKESDDGLSVNSDLLDVDVSTPLLVGHNSNLTYDEQVHNVLSNSDDISEVAECQSLISQSISLINYASASPLQDVKSLQIQLWGSLHDVIEKYFELIDKDILNTTFNTYVDRVIVMNENLALNTVSEYKMYEYKLDNALLKRMLKDFDSSINLLDDLLLEMDGMDLEIAYVNYWLCHIEVEREALLSLLTPDEFFTSISNCEMVYEEELSELSANYNIVENAVEIDVISISPNPNTGTFVVNVENAIAGSQLQVVNSYSQPIAQENIDVDGTTSFQFNGYATGFYTVYYLENGAVVDSEGIVVE